MTWYSAVALYAEYQKKSAATTAPYSVLPAYVYRAGDETKEVPDSGALHVATRERIESRCSRECRWVTTGTSARFPCGSLVAATLGFCFRRPRPSPRYRGCAATARDSISRNGKRSGSLVAIRLRRARCTARDTTGRSSTACRLEISWARCRLACRVAG